MTPGGGPTSDGDTAPVPAKRAAFEPAERLLRPTGYDPDMKRPITTVAGAGIVFLRVLAGLLWILEIAADWSSSTRDAVITITGVEVSEQTRAIALGIVLGVLSLVLFADVVFAILILRGHNWPRVVVMCFSVVSISSAFVAWWAQGQEITYASGLVSTGLDVLLLLALSSRSAAAYARRNERR